MFGKKDSKSKSSKTSKQRGVEASHDVADCGSKTSRDSKSSRASKQFSTKQKKAVCLPSFVFIYIFCYSEKKSAFNFSSVKVKSMPCCVVPVSEALPSVKEPLFIIFPENSSVSVATFPVSEQVAIIFTLKT